MSPRQRWWTEEWKLGGELPVGTIVRRTLDLNPAHQAEVRVVAERVAKRYEEGKVATMKFMPSTSIAHVNLNGFGAEYAVALLYRGFDEKAKLPWNRGLRTKPDVGDRVEVRWTGSDKRLFLPFYTYDKTDRIFILTSGEFPHFVIHGWAWGFELYRRENYVQKGDDLPGSVFPARVDSFFLHRDELHPWPPPPCFKEVLRGPPP